MKRILPIDEALSLTVEIPEVYAILQDRLADGYDTVEISIDEDGIRVMPVDKQTGPTSDSVHVPTTEWRKKPSHLSKAVVEEERYTFSPWYVPDSLDAHGEWTDPKEVQHAFWKYLANEDRDIRLQHNTDIVAGRWVEGATWPYEVEVEVKHPEGEVEYKFPAGTPFLGIIWEPWAWELIKSGEIRGLSIGGTAQRAEMELSKLDYNPTGTVEFAKMIQQVDGKWQLLSQDGSKLLGTFDTKADAEAREAEINRIKHMVKATLSLDASEFAKKAPSTGDFVSWNSSGGRARGKIDRIERNGEIKVPNSDFTITGDDDNPAALITVWREFADGWKATDTKVGHKLGTLTVISNLNKNAPFIAASDYADAVEFAKEAYMMTEPTKEGLAAELSDLLGEVVAFRFIAQGFSWNVSGPDFQQFHSLFCDVYDEADKSIDVIAQNIRKLNFDAPFMLSDFMGEVASLDIPDTNDPIVMAKVLYIANEQVRSTIVAAYALATSIGEQGVANYLAELQSKHSEWQWKLRLVVGDDFADAYEVNIDAARRLLQLNLTKHLSGQHDQSSHGRGGGTGGGYGTTRRRRAAAINAGQTRKPLARDAEGRVINPEATGGYKAGIPEEVTYRNTVLTPEHSLWHHMESDGKGGYQLTKERKELHNKIIEDATKNVPVSDDPTFNLLGGGPASGKSTAVRTGLTGFPNGDSAVQINADDVKSELGEFERMRLSSSDDDFFNAAAFSHEESSLVAKDIQKVAFLNRQNVVLDGTGNSSIDSLAGKVEAARASGYKVNAAYITVPTQVALNRANARSLGETSRRFVPDSVVVGTHRSVSQVFPEAVSRGLFDDIKLIDNTGSSPVLIGDTQDGQFTVANQDLYDAFLTKGNG
jgi:starvation-inducible DNA-binding protein